MNHPRKYYEKLFISNYESRYRNKSNEELSDDHRQELKSKVSEKTLEELKNLVHQWCI
jgi:hypothetical protein